VKYFLTIVRRYDLVETASTRPTKGRNMSFFPKGALEYSRSHNRRYSDPGGSLQGIVGQFPPNLKQAMFAAAKRGGLQKGTWSGCAFNAAGTEIGRVVQGTGMASQVFGVSPDLVDRFISFWDNSTTTSYELADILLKAGLTDPPVKPDKKGRRAGSVVFVETIFKGTASQFVEELEKWDGDLSQIDGFTVEMKDVAEQLLCNA
jgi:hypothetical protein